MIKRKLLILMMIILLVFSGCSKKESRTRNTNEVMPVPTADVSYNSIEKEQAEYTYSANQGTIPQDKKIIQNFQVNIIAEDIKSAAKEIANKTKELGGYTETEDITEYLSNAVIRIPSQKADLFIEYLEKNYEVTNKNKSIEDITDIYVDNAARLKNLRAEELQVLEIMKKANTVEEILKVQSELYRIREEIEILESRKTNWDRQVDYSTVRLNINKKQMVSDKKIKILSSSEFFDSMGQGFKNTFMSIVLSLQTLIIFLFSNLIPLVIIGGLVYAGYRVHINRKNKL